MNTRIALILLTLLLCVSSRAQDSPTLSRVSPKLKRFLSDHPVAARTLSKTLSEAFASRSVEVYYFYTDDESVPRAEHYYPGKSSVRIVIRENQEPGDEYLSFIYETLNSEGEKRFQELFGMAKSGAITKPDFIKEVLKQEFQAAEKLKALLGSLELSKQEIAVSYFYNRFLNCPGNFDEFLSYQKKVSPDRDVNAFYGQEYDRIRNGS